jgi:alkanesulfonate monooxygenase SsuD/methylene tetrahydromethanopterin reductase-like flavin-dependent oxidoreductase (luciferase family)
MQGSAEEIMKFSFFNTFVYSSAELSTRGGGWPIPPSLYDPALGEKTFEQGLDEVRLADELGFDWVSASEHHYWSVSPTPNPAVLLGALTQVVKRAKLAFMGPLVSMNNPIRVAEEVAMLDQMSHGRLIVCFLRGTPNEFLAYDTVPEETRAKTQEAIALISRALTEPEPFAWEGRYFRYRTVSVWPGLSQRPMPLTFASGNSRESATYAASNRFAMALAYYPTHLCAELVAFYRDQCGEFGWAPTNDQLLYRCFVAVGDSDDEAHERQARFFGERGGMMAAPRKGRAEVVADQQRRPVPSEIGTDADGKNTSADATRGFALGGLAFAGGPDALVEQIRDFHEATGIGVLDVSLNGGGLSHEEHMASIRTFATKVMPRLRELGISTGAKEREHVAH